MVDAQKENIPENADSSEDMMMKRKLRGCVHEGPCDAQHSKLVSPTTRPCVDPMSSTVFASRNRWKNVDVDSFRGIVVPVTSLDRLHASARLTEAKGVYWSRPFDHENHKAMEEWVREQSEPDGSFAYESIAINKHNKPSYTRACKRLARSMPSTLRGAIEKDAELMCEIILRNANSNANTEKVQWLTLQIEIVERNSCSRWHQVRAHEIPCCFLFYFLWSAL